ncbi:hypothetical protein [Thalassobacillus hwangdonensis]|uniref:Uncharacterized protein n=1 Tax=Thalassobacillus hwangdonensis TaxID=546108 RepID=A0ABW3L1R4_9BACI
MTILFSKGRELFEKDFKNQAFNQQSESKIKQPKKKSGKVMFFANKRK